MIASKRIPLPGNHSRNIVSHMPAYLHFSKSCSKYASTWDHGLPLRHRSLVRMMPDVQSYREISNRLGLRKNTILDIVSATVSPSAP